MLYAVDNDWMQLYRHSGWRWLTTYEKSLWAKYRAESIKVYAEDIQNCRSIMHKDDLECTTSSVICTRSKKTETEREAY